jgi:release factor glutamine methyltransferase
MTQSEMLETPRFGETLAQLERVWAPLPDKPEETLELTARALWFAAAGDPRSVGRCSDGNLPRLDEAAAVRLGELIGLRSQGTPLAHITRRQNFAGLEMLCGPEALIPRRETELLARTAIEVVSKALEESESALGIDVCTGSGNVALALSASDPRVTVIGADISSDALRLAGRNALHLGLSARVSFVASNLFDAIDASNLYRQASVITCNPPYIASAKVSSMAAEISEHEPRLAFDGGAFGLSIISRLLSDSPKFLRQGASLCFEVGAGNGRFVADRVRRNPAYSAVREVSDEVGVLRVLVATVA